MVALLAACAGGDAPRRDAAEPESSVTSGAPLGQRRYSEPQFGWTITFPVRWHATPVKRIGFVSLSGAAFASFPLEHDPLAALDEAPRDGIALLISHQGGGTAPDLFRPEARFPLKLSNFVRLTRQTAPVGKRILVFSANGWELRALAYIGAEATRDDRAALSETVASLRFRPLRERTVTAGHFYVLGTVERYAVGSVTRFGARELPHGPSLRRRSFFLIRAPGGFYAVGHTANLQGGFPACDVRFDASRFEFFCLNGARWDRLGRVLGNPDRDRYRDDPLAVFATKVGQDGHVLVSPHAYTTADRRLAARLWPGG